MAHFAELDENNVVKRVIVISNDVLFDENGVENETSGVEFCKNLYGQETIWKQTSYNTKGGVHLLGGVAFRKNFAVPEGSYNETIDAFIDPKPYDSWVLEESSGIWEAPTPMPSPDSDGDQRIWVWDETNLQWTEWNGVI